MYQLGDYMLRVTARGLLYQLGEYDNASAM